MKKLSSVSVALFVLSLSFFALLPKAEAVDIILDNHRDQKLTASFIYYDLNQSSWCCEGWWGVKALNVRTIRLPHDPDKRIYYYIKAGGEAVFRRSEGWARWDVISNIFKYYEHDGCPHGKNPRAVYFNCSETVTGDSWELNVR